MKREKGSFGALAYAAVEYANAKSGWMRSAARKTEAQKRADVAVKNLKAAARAFS